MYNHIKKVDLLRYANMSEAMSGDRVCLSGQFIEKDNGYEQRFSFNNSRLTKRVQSAPDKTLLRSRQNDAGMLVMAGMNAPDGNSSELIELLSFIGVFQQNAIIVGSHAFAAIGNNLGVQWAGGTATDGVDLAREVSLAGHDPISTRKMLEQAKFTGIPSFTKNDPPTTFRHANKMKVDFLTPLFGRPSSKPEPLHGMQVFAEPMRFLDYLIKDPQEAVLLTRYGTNVLVPQSARFALHKCIVAQRRNSDIKRDKDLLQAESILSFLEQRFAFLITNAWEDLPWQELASEGMNQFRDQALVSRIRELLSD